MQPRHLALLFWGTASLGFLHVACVSVPSLSLESDMESALNAALSAIESRNPGSRGSSREAPVVIVLTRTMPPELRRAVTALRDAANDFDLPDLEKYSLPRGYLQIEALTINGDSAVFKGLLGPVPALGNPAWNGCGLRYEIHLTRDLRGGWLVTCATVVMC
jgi:hypothetical protein